MTTKNETKPILLIDGYHLLHKGYYGTLKRKKLSRNKDGVPINAIYTFAANIFKFINSNKYHSIIVTFDVDKESFRKQLYPNYKAKRKETPADLVPQMQLARQFLSAANITWYEQENYEGDDVIGTIARIANKLGYQVRILSNDKDTFQLVNEKTYVITNISKKAETHVITPKEVYEQFFCTPEQVADVKAMLGDTSDNIKGIRYMRHKQVYMLLKKYKSVENIIDNINDLSEPLKTSISENKDLLILNKKITTILTNLKLGRINFKPTRITYYKLIKFLKAQEMYSFVRPIRKKIEEISNFKTINDQSTTKQFIKTQIDLKNTKQIKVPKPNNALKHNKFKNYKQKRFS
ncbi:5'-3' exonuclease [Mycoplasma putrefaciens]|uniref:5'-3' exonuclease n=1 Tax=Mycoplasma putrefaciens Mput9231 TaxID=1292033 RepID=M9WE39_9MOLU|nr:5'-3' exonuclease [Mycoplasma putrefaciens]AGJ91051.1 DNA polymerase I, 5'-3' exonuclease domain protein [Mycoplasma putrefaciens Mput9231]